MKNLRRVNKCINYLKIKIRHKLSRWPIFYAFIGSIGVVMIWRGLWVIADEMNMSGVESLILGLLVSIGSGLFVSFFVGDSIIITGIKKEKRIDEKTAAEIKKEEITLKEIKEELNEIKAEI